MLTLVSALLLLCGEQDGHDVSGTCGDPQDMGGAGAGAAAGGGASSGRGSESFEDRLNEIVDNVMHSKMIEDLKLKSSEVMEELKNLPAELRESLLLHVERQSLVVGGVVVAIGAALLLLGCVWIHWCHTEHGEYRYIPVSQVEEFLRYQNSGSSPSSSSRSQHGHSHRRRHKHSHHSSSHRHKQGSAPSEGSQLTQRRTDHDHIANGGQ